jgi:hypothetical protein
MWRLSIRDACCESGIERRPGRKAMLTERLRHIENFRIQRASELSKGPARSVDILAAQMARAARENAFCSVHCPGIDWPAVEADNPEAGR